MADSAGSRRWPPCSLASGERGRARRWRWPVLGYDVASLPVRPRYAHSEKTLDLDETGGIIEFVSKHERQHIIDAGRRDRAWHLRVGFHDFAEVPSQPAPAAPCSWHCRAPARSPMARARPMVALPGRRAADRIIPRLNRRRRITEESNMPFANIKTTKGVTREQKAQLVKDVTDSFVRVLGKKPEFVHVVIQEINEEDWGFAGLTVEEHLKRQGLRAAAPGSPPRPHALTRRDHRPCRRLRSLGRGYQGLAGRDARKAVHSSIASWLPASQA